MSHVQIFHYLGVEGRLRALLADPQVHAVLKLPEVPADAPAPATARNIWESSAWHQYVSLGEGRAGFVPEPTFATENDRGNIVLSLNIDGFRCWKNSQYSLTPFTLMILNLPENLRHMADYLILAALVPGPRKAKNLSTYLELLVEELLRLHSEGFDYEVQGVTYHARVKLLCTCADYPGHSDINCQTWQGEWGCIKCELKVSEREKNKSTH